MIDCILANEENYGKSKIIFSEYINFSSIKFLNIFAV